MGILQQIETMQEKDEIIKYITTKEVPTLFKGSVRKAFRKRADKFKWTNNILYFSSNGRFKRFFCDFEEEEKKEIVRLSHQQAHLGTKKIYKLLQVDHYAITRELVDQIVSSCSECHVANPLTTKQPIRAIKTKHVRERFQMDCVDYKTLKAMTHSVQPSLPAGTQMQVQQQVTSQPIPRQMQVLAHPVVVAKPNPVVKPQPQEKRLLAVANHQRGVMSSLASLWKSGKLCDAGISNGSSTVKVHKLVLSAVCPKLLSVSNMDKISHKFLQVNFPGTVSTEALNAFAEYMYNGILDLDRDILEQLKIIAKRLDMEEFEKLCDSHIPNHKQKPASAATAASFTNVPLIQTTMTIPAMTLSLASFGSTISSAQSINTPVIDIKQEISEDELAQVKKKPVAIFSQESDMASVAPNKSGNVASFVISPSIKTEPVGPEDNKYGHWCGSNSNPAFTSTTSSSSSSTIATASTSIASSTEFAIPFSEATDVKSTRLKAPHSYEATLVSDLSPVSGIVEMAHSKSSSMNEDTSKSLSQPLDSLPSIDLPNSNNAVYPVRLFSAMGDNLPLLATHSSEAMTMNSLIPSEKT